MWNLCPKISSSNREDSVPLLVGKEYVVGRKDCPILIKDDPSISRKHAVLTVQHDVSHLGDPSKIPEVMLSDSSKYGTSVNGVKVTKPTRLTSGDEILFGNHHSIYRLTYSPLVVVTSCLDNSKKKTLKKQIHALGGHLLSEWKSESITHLVMEGLLFTIKVIHALAECCPIVTPNMFDEIIKAVETKSSFPAPKMFLPPLKEESIKSDGPLFLPDKRRKTLFNGKTFIFLSSKQYKRTHAAIEMCDGKTILKDSISNNSQDNRIFLEDECCVMMVDQKERESYSLDMKQWISQIMDLLKSHNKRPIPESELGLAILQMKLTNYCNPDINAVPTLTQNIVCQSLNVGLDDMSQVFSPQNKGPFSQKMFKKPAKEDSEKEPDITFLRSTVAKPSSTSTIAETQQYSQEKTGTRKEKEEVYKGRVSETQESTPRVKNTKPDVKISPIPESMNVSFQCTKVLAADTPNRTTNKSSVFANDVKEDVVIPESEGLNNTNTSRIVAESGNERIGGKTNKVLMGKESEKHGKSDVIPESMGMDGSFVRPGKDFNNSQSARERQGESGWKPLKRTRILESVGEIESEKEVIPTKRAKKDLDFGSSDQEFSAQGFDSNEDERGIIKKEKQSDEQQLLETSQSGDIEKTELSPSMQPQNGAVPDGFMTTRRPGIRIKKSPEPVDEEDGLPRNLVVVDVVSLIVQKPKKTASTSNQVVGKNFKKFKKQWYAGCDRRFPKIIGGSDLVVHQTSTGIDQEDWFIEAREANKEQDKRDRMEELLFMSDAGLPQGRKRRAR